MSDEQQKAKDEAGPEDAAKVGRAIPEPSDAQDATDAEGHGLRKGVPYSDKPGPDEAVTRHRAIPDADDAAKPGPDDARISDRNLKVGIIPVVWD